MTTAIIYTRYSPRRTKKDDAGAIIEVESCNVQEALCLQYAASKGYTIGNNGDAIHDEDISGKDEARPLLWKAIGLLGRGDVLLVLKLDRLARNVFLAELLRREVEGKIHARIEAVSGDVQGNGPEQTLMRQMMQAFAEFERKQTAARTQAAMLRYQSQGKRMGRFAPYGWAVPESYDTNSKVKLPLVVNPAEQEAVTHIKTLADTESLCAFAIAIRMNGDPQWRRLARHGRWDDRTVRKIMARE